MAKISENFLIFGVVVLNTIKDRPFQGCSWMGEAKKTTSLKSIKYILQ